MGMFAECRLGCDDADHMVLWPGSQAWAGPLATRAFPYPRRSLLLSETGSYSRFKAKEWCVWNHSVVCVGSLIS